MASESSIPIGAGGLILRFAFASDRSAQSPPESGDEPHNFLHDTFNVGEKFPIIKTGQSSAACRSVYLLLSACSDFRVEDHCEEKSHAK